MRRAVEATQEHEKTPAATINKVATTGVQRLDGRRVEKSHQRR
jgi:hypothetical protein